MRSVTHVESADRGCIIVNHKSIVHRCAAFRLLSETTDFDTDIEVSISLARDRLSSQSFFQIVVVYKLWII